MGLYSKSSDLHEVYPDPLGLDRRRFADWLVTDGAGSLGGDRVFLDPIRESLPAADAEPPGQAALEVGGILRRQAALASQAASLQDMAAALLATQRESRWSVLRPLHWLDRVVARGASALWRTVQAARRNQGEGRPGPG
jgi:hypothetical protein